MNTNECPHSSLLDQYCHNVLEHERRTAIDKHLATCRNCRSRVDDLELANNTVDSHDLSEQGSLSQHARHLDATMAPDDKETIGNWIGPYKLLEVVGEGGMGQVYRAEQREPVKRIVALKVIKAGMDTRQVIARFEAERQALALMDHPNIAKVLDAGTTPQGRPFFAMEFVAGQSITQFCDQHKLNIKRRLELFQKVCQAIQHAHQKGIIHRDLKPSNILVSMSDNGPAPRVIDFGLAKATGQSLTDKSMFTQHGQVVGTFEYMSPEQAVSGGAGIDTRTDIFSLGVILYELLTGSTPLRRESIRKAAVMAIISRIQDEEPTKPSSRIVESSETVKTISEVRKIEPRRMSSVLKGDLDWIVLKALEKDPNRRYESANGLGMDVWRHLNHEPVTASPPSTVYRLKKFASKNRGLFVSMSAVILAMLVGTVISTWLAIRASRAEAAAARSESSAKQEARIATEISNFLQEDLLAKASPFNESDPDLKLRTVLDRAAESIKDRFENEPLVEAAIRHTLGTTYDALGESEFAKQQLRRAYELRLEQLGKIHPDTLEAKTNLAAALIPTGDYNQAEVYQKEVVKAWREISPAGSKEVLVSRLDLVKVYIEQARYELANKQLTELKPLFAKSFGEADEKYLQVLESIARVAELTRDFEKAEILNREIIAARTEIFGAKHPFTLANKAALVQILDWQNRWQESRELTEGIIAAQEDILPPNHPTTIASKLSLAVVLYKIGEYDESEQLFIHCFESFKEKFGLEDVRTLEAQHYLAWFYQGQGENQLAEPWAKACLEGARKVIGKEHPNTMIAHLNYGILLHDLERFEEALPVLESCLEIERRISPNSRRLAVALNNLGRLLVDMKKV